MAQPVLTESDDRAAVRSAVGELLRRHLPPERAIELDASGTFDREVWQALGDAGFLGLGTPEELGGSGGGSGDALVVVEEVARALPSLAVDLVLAGMISRVLADVEHPQRETWLAGAAAGTFIASFALSEPGAGTDLLAATTSARPSGDGWVLNGQKAWISLALHADTIFVLARTDTPASGRRASGLSLIAIDPDQPGVTIRRTSMAGMRAAVSCEIFLDDAVAGPDAIIGERGEAMRLLAATLDVERLLAAGISLGISRGALDLHLDHAKHRQAFGRPIGALQAVQHPAADSATELAAATALTRAAADRIDAGDRVPTLTAMAKLQAGETAARVVDRGMRAMGAMGLASESLMQMYFRDARLQLFSPISNEMTRNIIGEAMGLGRSY
ncbi:acyl-CoA dehydrogenase family protein [Aeromicrobium sp. Leaf350]|uniref:acyl-CoA dehydrogenase family protein n=1 Tax=Aeromicrobium sp. Leaf350 TaxID=2876565 RepID=UPI001E5D9966|nr:acyl-CoA dehydrogenase family protein [Aeromicrobium sp. Leaf350]